MRLNRVQVPENKSGFLGFGFGYGLRVLFCRTFFEEQSDFDRHRIGFVLESPEKGQAEGDLEV